MPIVNGLEAEFSDQLSIYYLDAAQQENAHLMQQYGLRGHPSFVFLEANGDVSQTFFGPQSDEVMHAAARSILP